MTGDLSLYTQMDTPNTSEHSSNHIQTQFQRTLVTMRVIDTLDVKYVSTVSVFGLETDCFYCFWSQIQLLHSALFLTVSECGSKTLYLAVFVDVSHCF